MEGSGGREHCQGCCYSFVSSFRSHHVHHVNTGTEGNAVPHRPRGTHSKRELHEFLMEDHAYEQVLGHISSHLIGANTSAEQLKLPSCGYERYPILNAISAFITLLVAAPICTLLLSTTNLTSKTPHSLTRPTLTPAPFCQSRSRRG